MDFALRPARPEDCPGLTTLCLRSKAHWGYDADFMARCRPYLTISETSLGAGWVVLAETGDLPLGTAEVTVAGTVADLDKIFVAPEALGHGIGRALMAWVMDCARAHGATRLEALADPNAVPFYEAMGGQQQGWALSEATPGRRLPRMVIAL
ncbi:GNAT family N-acetyltransferase [Solirhodobacter olei]|uniref:GNAT family N-acetyltransferase n=1 Tax=Solirhodobacter olei TaxID=2493082 RepID=UPI000FD98B31|nr:GNAT family N-acetyltransferase [Solirhodobacter olei]